MYKYSIYRYLSVPSEHATDLNIFSEYYRMYLPFRKSAAGKFYIL